MENRLGTCMTMMGGMALYFVVIVFLKDNNMMLVFLLLLLYGVVSWLVRKRKLLDSDVIAFGATLSSITLPCLLHGILPERLVFSTQALLMTIVFVIELIRWNYWIERGEMNRSGDGLPPETITPGA